MLDHSKVSKLIYSFPNTLSTGFKYLTASSASGGMTLNKVSGEIAWFGRSQYFV